MIKDAFAILHGNIVYMLLIIIINLFQRYVILSGVLILVNIDTNTVHMLKLRAHETSSIFLKYFSVIAIPNFIPCST